jgi:hypothetical protein
VANPRNPLPFNQRTDTGLMGYRYPEEPHDDRPVIRWQPFWTSEAEGGLYEAAVAKHARGPAEGPMAYAARISAVVTGAYRDAGQDMPRRGMSNREWGARQWEVKRSGMQHYQESTE